MAKVVFESALVCSLCAPPRYRATFRYFATLLRRQGFPASYPALGATYDLVIICHASILESTDACTLADLHRQCKHQTKRYACNSLRRCQPPHGYVPLFRAVNALLQGLTFGRTHNIYGSCQPWLNRFILARQPRLN